MHTLTTHDPVGVVLVVLLVVLMVVLVVVWVALVTWHTLTTADVTTLYPTMDDYKSFFSKFLLAFFLFFPLHFHRKTC